MPGSRVRPSPTIQPRYFAGGANRDDNKPVGMINARDIVVSRSMWGGA